MRISDWSSDVCASDLAGEEAGPADRRAWSRHGTVTARPSGTELGEQRLHLGDLGLLRVLDLLSHLEGARVLAVTQLLLGHVDGARRSEEHTSELQSLMRNSYAVF